MNEVALRKLDLTPEKVEAAEARMLALPQVECPLVHRFAPGKYIREVTMPAGALIVGHCHRYADWNRMVQGRATLLLMDGTTKEVQAPMEFMGQPGRKIAYIHETVVWQNVFDTDETDVEKLEEMFFVKSEAFLEDQKIKLMLDTAAHQEDRDDFKRAIAELGFEPDEVRRISENQSDQMVAALEDQCFTVGPSPIEGKGVFATTSIGAGGFIGLARVAGKRTQLGRYTNHAAKPNAIAKQLPDGDVVLVAVEDLNGCKGGQNGDEITVDYRQAALEGARKVCPQ